MNYDTIILEMLTRIQNLEQQVEALKAKQEQSESGNDMQKIGTNDVRAYIKRLMKTACENREEYIILRANDIHNRLKLKNRMPLVCNAMRQCMKEQDEVIHETPSGYSSTLEIKYCLQSEDYDDRLE